MQPFRHRDEVQRLALSPLISL